MPELRRLYRAGQWEEAHDLLLKTIPQSGPAVYVNPFVPACDLTIYPVHGDKAIENYQRCLDMDTGVVTVSYGVEGIDYKREYFSS